jgi:hypothetical protein
MTTVGRSLRWWSCWRSKCLSAILRSSCRTQACTFNCRHCRKNCPSPACHQDDTPVLNSDVLLVNINKLLLSFCPPDTACIYQRHSCTPEKNLLARSALRADAWRPPFCACCPRTKVLPYDHKYVHSIHILHVLRELRDKSTLVHTLLQGHVGNLPALSHIQHGLSCENTD